MKLRITDKQTDKFSNVVNALARQVNSYRDAIEASCLRISDERDNLNRTDVIKGRIHNWAGHENRLFDTRLAHTTATNQLVARLGKICTPVNAALAAVNGRANSFTVTSHSDLNHLAKRAEKLLEERGVKTKNRVGAVCEYRPSGPSANAYKYDAISTGIEITRFAGGWFLTGCSRESVYPREKEIFTIALTETAVADVAAHAMTGFTAIK